MNQWDRGWTDNERATLKALWPTTRSSQIAKILGRSKNSIIGQANRMNLELKNRDGQVVGPSREKKDWVPQPKEAIMVTKFEPPKAVVIKPPLPDKPPLPQRGPRGSVSILDVGPNQCRAIVAYDTDYRGLARFCAEPVDLNETFSFCPKHLGVYTTRGRG